MILRGEFSLPVRASTLERAASRAHTPHVRTHYHACTATPCRLPTKSLPPPYPHPFLHPFLNPFLYPFFYPFLYPFLHPFL